jgi:hypothetical protein
MGDIRNAYKSLEESLKGKNHSEDLGVDRRITLKWILGKQGLWVWIGFNWLRIRASGVLM